MQHQHVRVPCFFEVMNKASEIVSSLVCGTRSKNIAIAGKVYSMKSPTIRVICRVIREFSAISNVDGDITADELGASLARVVKGIAYAIVSDEENYEDEAGRVASEIAGGSVDEIIAAMRAFISMASLSEVFQLAVSAAKFAETAARKR